MNRLTAGLLHLPQALFCLCCAELLVITSTNQRRQSPSSPPPILEPSSASAFCDLPLQLREPSVLVFRALSLSMPCSSSPSAFSSFSFPFRDLQLARVPATPIQLDADLMSFYRIIVFVLFGAPRNHSSWCCAIASHHCPFLPGGYELPSSAQ